jgi:hypothetical protein
MCQSAFTMQVTHNGKQFLVNGKPVHRYDLDKSLRNLNIYQLMVLAQHGVKFKPFKIGDDYGIRPQPNLKGGVKKNRSGIEMIAATYGGFSSITSFFSAFFTANEVRKVLQQEADISDATARDLIASGQAHIEIPNTPPRLFRFLGGQYSSTVIDLSTGKTYLKKPDPKPLKIDLQPEQAPKADYSESSAPQTYNSDPHGTGASSFGQQPAHNKHGRGSGWAEVTVAGTQRSAADQKLWNKAQDTVFGQLKYEKPKGYFGQAGTTFDSQEVEGRIVAEYERIKGSSRSQLPAAAGGVITKPKTVISQSVKPLVSVEAPKVEEIPQLVLEDSNPIIEIKRVKPSTRKQSSSWLRSGVIEVSQEFVNSCGTALLSNLASDVCDEFSGKNAEARAERQFASDVHSEQVDKFEYRKKRDAVEDQYRAESMSEKISKEEAKEKRHREMIDAMKKKKK